METPIKSLDQMLERYTGYVVSRTKSLMEAAEVMKVSYRTVRNYVDKYGIDVRIRDYIHSEVCVKEVEEKIKNPSYRLQNLTEKDFNCMRPLTPEERDFFENRNYY